MGMVSYYNVPKLDLPMFYPLLHSTQQLEWPVFIPDFRLVTYCKIWFGTNMENPILHLVYCWSQDKCVEVQGLCVYCESKNN